MPIELTGYETHVRTAVSHYWRTIDAQAKKQKDKKGVIGGQQMDCFSSLIHWVVATNGMPDASIFTKSSLVIPGFFRPTKQWDLIVVHEHRLIAAVEFKSQAGSFGNNFNNHTEEALGSATDIWTAFREGAFGKGQPRPWVGWLMLLEDCAKSSTTVRNSEPHFKVFPEFNGTSYSQRYQILLSKLISEKLYNGVSLITSTRESGIHGTYSEPSIELGIRPFLAGLGGHVQTILASY